MQTDNFTHCFSLTPFILLSSYWVVLAKFLREFPFELQKLCMCSLIFLSEVVLFFSRCLNLVKFRDIALHWDWTYFDSFIHKEMEILGHREANRDQSMGFAPPLFPLKWKSPEITALLQLQGRWDACIDWILGLTRLLGRGWCAQECFTQNWTSDGGNRWWFLQRVGGRG